MMTALLLFFAGLVQDVLATLYIRAAAGHRFIWAGILSFAAILLAYGAFAALLETLLKGEFAYLLSYAAGSGIGASIACYRKPTK